MPDTREITTAPDDALLRVENLSRSFDVSPPLLNRVIDRQPRQFLKAVDGIDFAIRPGEIFSLVGES
ncbi:MAG: ABC transporter ATP-binding protein, partial [Pseudomonadota bacterium]|nr:ABC transporter ATP-binding protein [Pseudomonadota bacterium]